MEDNKIQEFEYRKSYRAYLSALAGLGLLALVEIGMLSLLVLYVIKNPTTKIVVGTLLCIFIIIPVFVLSWPLRTRHRLGETSFRLHYGQLKLDIPRDRITSARPVNQKITGFDTLGARYQEHQQRLLACFSMKGQILLNIAPSVETKRFSNIKEILFNVDDFPSPWHPLARAVGFCVLGMVEPVDSCFGCHRRLAFDSLGAGRLAMAAVGSIVGTQCFLVHCFYFSFWYALFVFKSKTTCFHLFSPGHGDCTIGGPGNRQ